MNRLKHTKTDEQIRIEQFARLIAFLILLIVMLCIGIAGAIKDARATATSRELPKVDIRETVANFTTVENDLINLGEFKTTAYCACFECCKKRPTDAGYGITATGTKATQGRTIAVDPTIIPYGTKVIIDGMETEYVSEDTGEAIRGNRIDIYFENHSEALKYGVQYKNVYLKGV